MVCVIMLRMRAMSTSTEVLREQAKSLEAVENACAYLAEAQAEVVTRRGELDEKIKATRGLGISTRRIAEVAGVSHDTVRRICDQ